MSEYDGAGSERVPEQDAHGGDGLPTYEDLTEQHAKEPNSRFGRWKSWIEKRATERYADVSEEEHARRRARGWELNAGSEPGSPSAPLPIVNEPTTPTPQQLRLRVKTDFLIDTPPAVPPKSASGAPPSYPAPPSPAAALPSPDHLLGEVLAPSHLHLTYFGSRFIPHARARVRCLLPLPEERLLLVGHDDGLSVLDMFPHEWTDGGLQAKGPKDAQTSRIWEGEGVFQMSVLEMEQGGEGAPQGVVLALVGGDTVSPRDQESVRALRMYNLTSLISLAKWAVSQRGAHPLDLRRPGNWHPQQTPVKKHRNHTSLTKSLRSLMVESPVLERTRTPSYGPPTARSRSPSPSESFSTTLKGSINASSAGDPFRPSPHRDNSSNSTASADSTWDVVDDLPLRWATDFVPLAAPGSRLASVSVIAYDLRLDEKSRTRGGALLAVATKSNILLYETPRGERVFRFVKDFYTPLAPRSLTFVDQSVQPVANRTDADVTRSPGKRSPAHRRNTSASDYQNQPVSSYPPQLSLFVLFEKKAGLIRIADSAVGEAELHLASPDDAMLHASTSPSAGSSSGWLSPTPGSGSNRTLRRNRASYDGALFGRDAPEKGAWLAPVRTELPTPSAPDKTVAVYLLTRGRTTHVVPAPLPAHISAKPPLRVFLWSAAPAHVAPRVCHTARADGAREFLQLVAFGDGVEVQEVSLDFLAQGAGAGKGKARATEPVCARSEMGGEAGFLHVGGHWQRWGPQPDPMLSRSYSTGSDASAASFDSMETVEIDAKMRMEQGIYGWVRNGAEDWRIFWVGGTGREQHDEREDDI